MSELKKTLGAVAGTAMMLNVVLGAGLLVLPGLAAKLAGASSFWAWIAAAVVSVPLLWVFAMLTAKFPHAGGIAHLAGQAFGRTASIVASFIFLGAVLLGLPSIALTGGYYFESAFGPALAPASAATSFLFSANSIAIFLLCFAGGWNLCAPRTAKKIGAVAAVLMIAFIVALIAASIYVLQSETSWQNTVDKLGAIANPTGVDVRAVSAVFFMVFFAFTGWEVAIGMSGEFKRPARNIPIAIFASFIVAFLLIIACVLVVLLSRPTAWDEAAFVHVLQPKFGTDIGMLVALGAVFLISVNLFAAVWGVSRMVFSLAATGVLPRFVGELHADRNRGGKTPRNAVLLLLGVLLLIVLVDRSGALGLDDFLFYSGQNFFILYGLVCAASVKKLDRPAQKSAALFALLLVCALVFWSADWKTAVYPFALALFAVGVSLATEKPRSPT